MFDTPEEAAIAVDDDLMSKGGPYKKLNFKARYKPPTTLVCRKCGKKKPVKDFLCRKHERTQCKACRREPYLRKLKRCGGRSLYIPKDLGAYIRFALSKVRCRAKKDGVSFTLTEAEVLSLLEQQNWQCAICGVTMTTIIGHGRIWTNMSIDRVTPSGPYNVTNVQLTCVGANRARLNLSMQEFINLCRQVVAFHANKPNA